MATRKGLVLSVSTPTRIVTSATSSNDHRERLAEIDRLVWATIPLMQTLAYNTPKLEAMREWLAAIDNADHPLYDQRQQKTNELAVNIDATREAVLRNARAVRVHAIRLPENLRQTIFARHGLDFSSRTGDSEADIDHQWRHVVELLGDEPPF